MRQASSDLFLLFMMLCLLQPYLASSSSPIILNLFTFFSLGILKVPWDSLVSISRLWISMSLFLVLDVKLFTKKIARSLVELLAEVGQVILAHGANVREGSNLLQHSFRHTHLGVCDRTPH